MTILDHIIANKYKEVAAKKAAFPTSLLEKSFLFSRETVSLAEALSASETGIIAEHKRRSPSKSVINDKVLVQDVLAIDVQHGFCGLIDGGDGALVINGNNACGNVFENDFNILSAFFQLCVLLFEHLS